MSNKKLTNFKLQPPKRRSQTKKKITETGMSSNVVPNTQSADMDIDDTSMQIDSVYPSKKSPPILPPTFPRSPSKTIASPAHPGRPGRPARSKSITTTASSVRPVQNKATTSNMSPATNKAIASDNDAADMQNIDQRTLTKLVKIGQRNSNKLDQLELKYTDLENVIKEQKTLIEEILSRLDPSSKIEHTKGKGRKGKNQIGHTNFYQDAIKKFSTELFREHKNISDSELKERFETTLKADDHCVKQLQKLSEKGVTFDQLWDEKIYSALLNANRTRKGYYVRRIKENLWSAFGINRITPFEDSYNQNQMRNWKQSENVKKVHEDLYKSINPEDPESETYISLIVRSTFSKQEQTHANVIWAQSVLETIFDENHLSTKIDSDVIESWLETLTDAEQDDNTLSEKSFETSPVSSVAQPEEVDVDNQ